MSQMPSPQTNMDERKTQEILVYIYNILSTMQARRQTEVSSNYTVILNDFYLLVDTTAARTITLPVLASVPKNFEIVVKDRTGNANANNITIDGNGAELIDGAANKVINTNYGFSRIVKANDGSRWLTVG